MANLYMMCGIQGSGKSTHAKFLDAYLDCEIISSDKIRAEIYPNTEYKDMDQNKVFHEVNKRIFKTLDDGKDVIFDACNANRKRRMHFLSIMKKYFDSIKCVWVATTYEKCLENNASRENPVPEEHVKRTYINFDVPMEGEGFDSIDVVVCETKEEIDKYLSDKVEEMENFDQENKNHDLSLFDHCYYAYDSLSGLVDNHNKASTALLHDIGKLYTKTFKTMKGEITEDAHYYNHDKVSAYMAAILLAPYCNDVKELIPLYSVIAMHMRVKFAKTDKAINKIKKLLATEENWELLQLLNKVDNENRHMIPFSDPDPLDDREVSL